MAQAQKVVQLHALSEEAALAWLQSQGTVKVSACELAMEWGWHRNKVGSKLKGWAATGAIQRKGKTISALSAIPQSAKVQNAKPVKSAPVHQVQSVALPVQTAKVQNRRWLSKTLSVFMFLAALCTIGVLIYINYVSWSALSENAPNVIALRVLSLVIDALIVILPVAAKIAPWRGAMLIWLIWTVCILIVLWTAIGFAFSNLGEVVESRRVTIDRKDILDDRLKGLRVKLANADEQRRLCESGGSCALAKDRKGRVIEVGRLTGLAAGLKSDIEKYEGIRANLPAIVVADPQMAGGVNAINRTTGYSVDLADARTGWEVVLALVLVLLPSGLGRVAVILW